MLVFGAAGLLLGQAALSGGCRGYTNYPPIEGTQWDREDPNVPTTIAVMTAALNYAVNRFPPEGQARGDGARFAINLPPGVRRGRYEQVARDVGRGAVPLTPESASLPIYHIAGVRTRDSFAYVDVLRPVDEVDPTPSGEQVYQCVEVELRGGFEPWHAVGGRLRNPGLIPTPPLYFMPEADRPYQAEIKERRDKEREDERLQEMREKIAPPPTEAGSPADSSGGR